jgi:KDO2-lipid IV(A) lauroyltransferase
MSLLGDRVADWGYAAGWMMIRAMPKPVARSVFHAAAIYAARGGGPEQLRKNLSRVLGVTPAEVPDTLMRAALISYARYWREAFQLPVMNHAAVSRKFDDNVVGTEHLVNGLAAGRGVVLALPHSGNWDMAGVWMTQIHGRFTTVVERLKPESLYRRFVAYRESLGFEVLPLSGGRQPTFDLLCQRLAENRTVCLMAERDLTRGGVPVNFFGEPARMPAGPAKLAVATGAALLPSHCWFTDDGWGFQMHPALDCTGGDISAITQTLADQFVEDIAAHPQDWHMLQPHWLADLSEAQRIRLGDV